MEFTSWELGSLSGGDVVQIEMSGTEANVKLMDASNFAAYKAGGRHHFYGGHYNGSPIRLPVPSGGQWFVTIDYGGFAGSGQASVRVLATRGRI